MNKSELLAVAKPILFNTPMVQAILDGRKTATRRVIKYPPCGYFEFEPPKVKAPYRIGDILYVRETWNIADLDIEDNTITFVYKANEKEIEQGARAVSVSDEIYDKYDRTMAENNPDWRPSIHMPKEAARIFLRVTDVRVERLQDITAQDLKQEGILQACYRCKYRYDYCGGDVTITQNCHYNSMAGIEFWKNDWISLWNSTIKKADLDRYGWNANPFVWVIEFERLEE